MAGFDEMLRNIQAWSQRYCFLYVSFPDNGNECFLE